MSDSQAVETPEVVGSMTEDQLERWSSLTSEEQLEFFEAESRKSGRGGTLEPVSWEEALASSTEATPDIEVAKRKRALVDVPFVIKNIKINQGQWGPFVTFTAITQTPIIQGSESNAVIVNDSSPNGLASQVVEIAKKHGMCEESGVLIKSGLKESIYYVDNDTRKVVGKVPVANSFQQSTFYLNL
jgi:hypothetical protein